METKDKCILCGAWVESVIIDKLKYKYACNNCGKYFVTIAMKGSLLEHYAKERYKISGYSREMTENGKEAEITSETITNILSSPSIPKTLVEKIEKLLLWYYEKHEYLGHPIQVSRHSAICFAVNGTELTRLYEVLENEKYINIRHDSAIHGDKSYIDLTLDGIKYCYKLLIERKQTLNAFVSLWINDEMKEVYLEAIYKAIEDCGFFPFRVDYVEHNNDITDEIIAGIKSSRFVLADFTGYRGGVYYEAGFARGLGIPVIYTCRKDWFDGKKSYSGKTVWKERVHFDVNHINFIIWETEAELYKKIVNRIKATIL